jgi:hypothetical protein
MNLTISATTDKPTITLEANCTNCIYRDFWSDLQNLKQHQVSGFDCSYPIVGSKIDRNIDFESVLNDKDIATQCPKYKPS